jgi:Recombination endonuclease VII
MAKILEKRCKDCVAEGITTPRKIAMKPDGSLQPGPRCVTHHRTRKRTVSFNAHANRIVHTYKMTSSQYWALYAYQGECCAGCVRATGKSKRLAIDHDHSRCDDHPPDQGCSRCWRGLLCSQCNELIGRYGIEQLARLIKYLSDPPARKFFKEYFA